MCDTIFLINSGKMILDDLSCVCAESAFAFHNVLDGHYVVYLVYNDNKEIVCIKVINVDYEFNSDIRFIDINNDVQTIFCASSRIGVFDSNLYFENTATKELQNHFYDLCCEVSSNLSGCGTIDNAGFVGYCMIGNYRVQKIVNDKNDVIGVYIESTDDIQNKIIKQF